MPSSVLNSYGIYGTFLSICAYHFPPHVNSFGNAEDGSTTERDEATRTVSPHPSGAIVDGADIGVAFGSLFLPSIFPLTRKCLVVGVHQIIAESVHICDSRPIDEKDSSRTDAQVHTPVSSAKVDAANEQLHSSTAADVISQSVCETTETARHMHEVESLVAVSAKGGEGCEIAIDDLDNTPRPCESRPLLQTVHYFDDAEDYPEALETHNTEDGESSNAAFPSPSSGVLNSWTSEDPGVVSISPPDPEQPSCLPVHEAPVLPDDHESPSICSLTTEVPKLTAPAGVPDFTRDTQVLDALSRFSSESTSSEDETASVILEEHLLLLSDRIPFQVSEEIQGSGSGEVPELGNQDWAIEELVANDALAAVSGCGKEFIPTLKPRQVDFTIAQSQDMDSRVVTPSDLNSEFQTWPADTQLETANYPYSTRDPEHRFSAMDASDTSGALGVFNKTFDQSDFDLAPGVPDTMQEYSSVPLVPAFVMMPGNFPPTSGTSAISFARLHEQESPSFPSLTPPPVYEPWTPRPHSQGSIFAPVSVPQPPAHFWLDGNAFAAPIPPTAKRPQLNPNAPVFIPRNKEQGSTLNPRAAPFVPHNYQDGSGARLGYAPRMMPQF